MLGVNGKNNLDRPAAIFMSLEIPVYAIWDCDKSAERSRAKQQIAPFRDCLA